MDESVGKFIESFGVMVSLAQQEMQKAEGGDALAIALDTHFGRSAAAFPVVVESLPPHRLVDVDLLMERLAAADPDARLIGLGADHRHHFSFADLARQARSAHSQPLAQPEQVNVDTGPDTQKQAVSFGLRLFRHEGEPIAVLQREARPEHGRPTMSLEVMAPEQESVAAFLTMVRADLESNSVFRGQVLALTLSEYGRQLGGTTFLPRPALRAGDIVLPDGVLDRIEQHTLGISRHAASLAARGQHLKRGLLLYGPPGTGKTHTVRYILSQSEGTTAIVLSGGSLARIAEAARMARAMAPAMVILEDCDLIAEDRGFGHGPKPLLFEVLDAMDGLDQDADVAFILTTNRAEVLERALAQRPGRVDLAVEIPLPSTREREALLRLYGAALPFTEEGLAEAARLTRGSTAALSKELVRRAVLTAEESGAVVDDALLAAEAVRLMDDSEALTRGLLGSSNGTTAPPPDPGANHAVPSPAFPG